uniref:Uncharacterized protein n=1 Tax=Timema douglasi TaxID=61478 RepID=A0A7R8VDC4_TIMDO|nr:unnamed protein product [Timema douglasi]
MEMLPIAPTPPCRSSPDYRFEIRTDATAIDKTFRREVDNGVRDSEHANHLTAESEADAKLFNCSHKIKLTLQNAATAMPEETKVPEVTKMPEVDGVENGPGSPSPSKKKVVINKGKLVLARVTLLDGTLLDVNIERCWQVLVSLESAFNSLLIGPAGDHLSDTGNQNVRGCVTSAARGTVFSSQKHFTRSEPQNLAGARKQKSFPDLPTLLQSLIWYGSGRLETILFL